MLFVSAAALASTPAQQAEAIYERGVAETLARRAERAAGLFEEAYGLDAQHRYAWNAAIVWEQSGSFARAHVWYRHATTVAADAEQRGKDLEAIGRVEGKLARQGFVRVVLAIRPRAAHVTVDDAPVALIGDARIVFLRPGSHRLEASAPGHLPVGDAFEVKAAIELRLERTLVSKAVAVKEKPGISEKPAVEPAVKPVVVVRKEPGPEPAGGWKRRVAYAAGGGALVAITVGGVLMGSGAAATKDADAMTLATRQDKLAYLTKYDDGLALHRAGQVALGLGVALGVGALWAWLTQPAEAPPGVAVAP